MRAFRVTREHHADLSGEGGRRAGGRWHSKGRQILYTAADPGLAVLEVLVHLELDVDEIPTDYVLMVIDLPDPVPVLPTDAVCDLSNKSQTRAIGDQWLVDCNFLAIEVPSVIVPLGRDVLINPLHTGIARMPAPEIYPLDWDQRLFRRED